MGMDVAQRIFWRGYLKLSLVTCQVTMTPAVTESGKLRFHNLNRATGNRVLNEYVDAVTGKPVDDEDQRKGYDRGEDEHVLFTDEELDDVALESTRTIDIETFVPLSSIGWIWYDSPHYLAPADKVGQEAFSVIRDAMAKSEMAGISRLVLYRREHAVLLVPRDRGMVVWTLRHSEEYRPPGALFDGIGKTKPPAATLLMMKKLIGERMADWSPDMVSDPVEKRLQDIIEARKNPPKKKAAAKARPAPRGNNVIDITEALRQSLAAEKKAAK